MTISYDLKRLSHNTREKGMCAMEWVAYLAGEKHTSHPECVDWTLHLLGIVVNDHADNEQRQRLRPYLARMIGTADDGKQGERLQTLNEWLYERRLPTVDSQSTLHDFFTSLRDWGGPGLANIDAAAMDEVLPLLDSLLPTEAVELPQPAQAEYEALVKA